MLTRVRRDVLAATEGAQRARVRVSGVLDG